MKKRILLLSFIALSSIPTFAQNAPSYVPSNGLVGWWPFNGNANDESGNNLNQITYGPQLSSDRYNLNAKAYFFNGNGDYMERPTANILNTIQDSLTISAWIYLQNTPTAAEGGAIVARRDFVGNPNGERNHFQLNVTSSNELCFAFNNNTNTNLYTGLVLSPSNSVVIGVWNHVSATFKNGVVKLYVNGTLITSQNLGFKQLSANNHWLNFGRIHRTQGTTFFAEFPGKIDDIGIWNRALTECEIQDLFHAHLGSQAISAGADQSICAGDNVTLNGTGGSNYQWNNGVVDGQAFAPAQSNAYVVTAQDTLGCTGTDTVVVTVLENATSTLTQTALDSYTLNGQTYTQSGTYTQTLTAANGCDSTITLNLTLNFTGIDELGTGAKKLVKITDLNGKIIPRRKNTLMLFIYEDGTMERVVEMEE